MCMHGFLCVSLSVYGVQESPWTYLRRQRILSIVFSCCLLPYYLRHCFSLNWELADSARPAARKPQESSFYSFPSTGITGTEFCMGLSVEGMGSELRSLSLCGIYLLIIPNPIIKLFIFNTDLSDKFQFYFYVL